MKKGILIPVILILIVAILAWAFLTHGRASGEISFSARIDRVENSPPMLPYWKTALAGSPRSFLSKLNSV